MMGQHSGNQPQLFYYNLNLEERVPHNHILRKIREKIDFDFIYQEVQECYGDNGNGRPWANIRMARYMMAHTAESL